MTTGEELLVYAGRFADRVRDAGLEGCRVFSEWDVLQHELTAALDNADTVLLLDPISFPFEVMAEAHWNIPMVTVLPDGFETRDLIVIFGSLLFERLGPFDAVATADSSLWEELRGRYRWMESQRLPVKGGQPEEVVAEVRALFEEGTTAPMRDYRYGGARSVYRMGRLKKTVHRAQVAALEAPFKTARADSASDELDVLGLGRDAVLRASSLDPDKVRLSGVGVEGDEEESIRTDVSEVRLDKLDTGPRFPYEEADFDLVFSVDFMSRYSTAGMRTLISEMWRVARPGGRLLFLEEFVPDQHPDSATEVVSVSGFVELILDATAGRVALEHVESLRYPHDDLFRAGVLSFSKLGGAETMRAVTG